MQKLAHHYARALVLALAGLSFAECEKRFLIFKEVLARRGHARLLPAVLFHAIRLHDAKKLSHARILVADEHVRTKYAQGIAQASRALGIEGESLPIEIRHDIIGGFCVRTSSAQYDATYKHALIALYQRLVA